MSAAFTPGPWELCDRGDYGDFDGNSRIILADDGCGCPMRLAVVQVSSGDYFDENEATAALIAAAPELYEALEVIAGCGAVDVSNTAIIVGHNANVVLQQAWSALRKARGEA